VPTARIRCQVLETPTHDQWLTRGGGGPRDLLPWADPYIAGLVRRLESRYSTADERDVSDPFADGSSTSDATAFDDGWQEDAFMPRPLDVPRFHCYPPVVGEFPLLEESDEA
jgi:hypothetical protein